jgi:DNA repair protein RadD
MYTPRPYQNDAVAAIFAYYAKGGVGNPVVAMPTATGKSLVIAEFIKFVIQRWPRQRIILLTHVKELIKQNAEKLREQWPQVPLGIFSAGLNQRDVNFPVVYGGVASVVNCVELFGWRDLMLVDEGHLISPKEDTNYQEIIKRLRAINPAMKVIAFTATPYRTGQGMISDGPIFTDVCFDLCSFKEFNKLIADGYLVAPIPKSTTTELDTSKVKITAGEFNKGDLQKAVDIDSVTYAACREIVEEGFDRKCWLIFASGVKHAEHVASCLSSMGIDVTCIHSKLSDKECDRRYEDWKAGKYKAIVNYGKLTTGVDHPPIDLIAVLRPTMSTVLWVQMLGRGTRPSPATLKENCLVLDFARNTIRLGPINDPVIPRKRVKGEVPGVAPVRICPQCGVYNHARSTECSQCGFVFPKIEKLFHTAGTDELIRRDEPVVNNFDVQRIVYNRHQKMGKPPMIKVSYFCGLHLFSEWICFEHGGYATMKAHAWWKARTGLKAAPPSTDEALKFVSQLRVPRRIRVWSNKKYPEVLGYEY